MFVIPLPHQKKTVTVAAIIVKQSSMMDRQYIHHHHHHPHQFIKNTLSDARAYIVRTSQ